MKNNENKCLKFANAGKSCFLCLLYCPVRRKHDVQNNWTFDISTNNKIMKTYSLVFCIFFFRLTMHLTQVVVLHHATWIWQEPIDDDVVDVGQSKTVLMSKQIWLKMIFPSQLVILSQLAQLYDHCVCHGIRVFFIRTDSIKTKTFFCTCCCVIKIMSKQGTKQRFGFQ